MRENIEMLYQKYLAGEASKEELKKLQGLIKDENNLNDLKENESLWTAGSILSNGQKFDKNEGWDGIKKHITNKSSNRFSKIWIPVLRIASVVIVTFFLSYYLFKINHQENKFQITNIDIKVPLGSKSQMVLPDGTQVWLNSGTHFVFPQEFDKKERLVKLEGEAYFIVTSNKKRPFVVEASDLRIKALGTTFNIKSYESDKYLETTLVEGKVIIEKNISKPQKTGRIVMSPSQKVIYNKQESKARKVNLVQESDTISRIIENTGKTLSNISSETIEENTSWKDNKLVFRSTNFMDLAETMERWYDVHIIIESEDLKSKTFNGIFEKESLEQALNALQLASQFDYTIDQDTIFIMESP